MTPEEEKKLKKRAYDMIYRASRKEALSAGAARRYLEQAPERIAKSKAHYDANRTEILAKHREAAKHTREDIKEYQKSYRAEHTQEMRTYKANYVDKNREILAKRAIAKFNLRYKTEPAFKLASLLRNRIYVALVGRVAKPRTMETLGCSWGALKEHLESQFRPGMSWGNYGPIWHVDHIKPVAAFCLEDPEQVEECFHFTNLQPLFALENLIKNDTY